MSGVLYSVLALIVTLGILVSIHEWGHFVVARRSGVKVLRFSIGFGPPLWSRMDRHGTEFVIAALPLGGYVKMLDEREGEVPPEDAGRSYRRLTPWWRIGIALGGPGANFLLAFVVFWALLVVGRSEPIPLLDTVSPESPAYAAGFRGGEEIVAIDDEETPSWADVGIALAARLGDTGAIEVTARPSPDGNPRTYRVPIENWHRGEGDPDLLGSLGFALGLAPIAGDVLPDSAAAEAGIRPGDRVRSIDGEPVSRWDQMVERISGSPGKPLSIVIERDGRPIDIVVTPRTAVDETSGKTIGRVGVRPRGPITREVAYGPIESFARAGGETWAKTKLTLDLLKKMIVGMVSTKNLSGPITIAKVAGDSARYGTQAFLEVLALLSISLGVLNLLPIPILDGGHVLFCLAEVATGKPIPERVQVIGVQIGLFIVGGLMVLAFYNDLTRLFGVSG
jgi:regulator of sigma E protease